MSCLKNEVAEAEASIREAVCKECGKKFLMSGGSALYVYKIGKDKFCSWSCLQAKRKKIEKEKAEKIKARKAALKARKEHEE